jgi:hypothetical protein
MLAEVRDIRYSLLNPVLEGPDLLEAYHTMP